MWYRLFLITARVARCDTVSPGCKGRGTLGNPKKRHDIFTICRKVMLFQAIPPLQMNGIQMTLITRELKEECIWRICIFSHAHTHTHTPTHTNTQVILSDRCLLLWLINDCASWKPLPSLNPLKGKKNNNKRKKESQQRKLSVTHQTRWTQS